MKYIKFEKEMTKWEMVFCRTDKEGEEFLQEVAKAMYEGDNFKIFHTEENICINSGKIKNDRNMFTLQSGGTINIWQLGSKVEDMSGFIVPNLYYVRKVGILIQEE